LPQVARWISNQEGYRTSTDLSSNGCREITGDKASTLGSSLKPLLKSSRPAFAHSLAEDLFRPRHTRYTCRPTPGPRYQQQLPRKTDTVGDPLLQACQEPQPNRAVRRPSRPLPNGSNGILSSAARTNAVLRIVMSTITVVCSVSSLPLLFYTMSSHRDIYI
jgi:hypothetical protein